MRLVIALWLAAIVESGKAKGYMPRCQQCYCNNIASDWQGASCRSRQRIHAEMSAVLLQ